MSNFANRLLLKLGNKVKIDEPINTKCSFKIGGKCRFFVKADSLELLTFVLKVCKAKKVKWFLLGGGSNVLFPKFFNGVIIDIKQLNKIEVKGTKVFAAAGAMLQALCFQCKMHLLSGLEWAIGIPGTVGGAVKMNAGAFGYEFLDFVSAVYIFDGKNIVCKTVSKKDYGYRQNRFLKKKHIVLGVDLKLKPSRSELIERKMKIYIQKRFTTQNVGFPSAGSVFKKTDKGAASLLIDKAGLKGLVVGDAMVSTKHAGFIVNKGRATQHDVVSLAKIIRKSVYKKFGVKLQFEICIV